MMLALAWNLIPAPMKWVAALALVALMGGAYVYVRHQGYADGYSVSQAICEADKQLQAATNRDALAKAERRLLEQADALSLKNMELDNAIDELSRAAAEDPDGGLDGLGPDSVRRLNTIR